MLCLLTLLIGCSTQQPKPIIDIQTVTVTKDRYIPTPEYLTNPVEVVSKTDNMDTISLGAGLKMCIIRTKQANGQLKAISEIKP